MMITSSLSLGLLLDFQVLGHFKTVVSSPSAVSRERTRIGSLRIRAGYPFSLQAEHVEQAGQYASQLVQLRSLSAESRPHCTSVVSNINNTYSLIKACRSRCLATAIGSSGSTIISTTRKHGLTFTTFQPLSLLSRRPCRRPLNLHISFDTVTSRDRIGCRRDTGRDVV